MAECGEVGAGEGRGERGVHEDVGGVERRK